MRCVLFLKYRYLFYTLLFLIYVVIGFKHGDLFTIFLASAAFGSCLSMLMIEIKNKITKSGDHEF